MTNKNFKVIRYSIHLGRALNSSNPEIVAQITCRGQHGQHYFFIMFWPRNTSRPENNTVIETEKISGVMNVPEAYYPWYLDILRNEGSVFVYVNDSDPSKNRLYVRSQYVGEG